MNYKLVKTTTKKSKRLGRGYGSGKGGHTSSRGQKGQKTRSSLGILFEGVKFKKSFYKRLPLSRGKGKFKSRQKPTIVRLGDLDVFPSGAKVNIDSLIKKGVVDEREAKTRGVKILGDKSIKKKLTVQVPITKPAAELVKKAGGSINVN